MNDRVKAPAPVHLWIVGVLALLWNGFGCFDYFMTRTRGAEYIASMMPGADGDAFMAYINGFPLWASAGWALGVWGGLAGAILLLMRSRLAVAVLFASLVGAVLGIGYQLTNPIDMPAMQGGFNAIAPYMILAITAFLAWYARDQAKKGVLA